MTIDFSKPMETLRLQNAKANRLGGHLERLNVSLQALKDGAARVELCNQNGTRPLGKEELAEALEIGFEIMIRKIQAELDLLLRELGLIVERPPTQLPKEIED